MKGGLERVMIAGLAVLASELSLSRKIETSFQPKPKTHPPMTSPIARSFLGGHLALPPPLPFPHHHDLARRGRPLPRRGFCIAYFIR
eukprot:7432806-Karenia_brevis.AAC.1